MSEQQYVYIVFGEHGARATLDRELFKTLVGEVAWVKVEELLQLGEDKVSENELSKWCGPGVRIAVARLVQLHSLQAEPFDLQAPQVKEGSA